MNLLYELPQPVIFAHRGSSAYAPENTLAAFRKAAEQGADAIELDVKLSLDGEVMVMHDPTVDRTTDGKGAVNSLSLADLKTLDAGSHFDIEFMGEPVPTLDEVLEEVGRQLFINIELTNYTSPRDELPDKALELVMKHDLLDRVLFSSFHPMNLYRIRRLNPDALVALLALPGKAGRLARGWVGRLFSPKILHPNVDDVGGELLRRKKARSRRVHVWTVNDLQDIRRLADAGANGIITDDPCLALKVREAA